MNKAAFPEMYFFEKEKAQNVYISKHNFKNIKPHSHEYYELEYFYEGSGVCEINGKEYPFKKGDISFVSPLDIHGYRSKENVKTLTVHFRIANLSKILLGITDINACLVKSTEELSHAFDILMCQNKDDKFYDLLCEKMIETILILFLKTFKTSTKNVMPKEIYSAIEFIIINFKNNISLKSVSEYLGYSQEHFSRMFKKYTGLGFHAYLTELRLAYAKNLLDSQQITVTEICYESGFGCIRSFHRAFKKKYGYSPKTDIKKCL